MDRLTDIIDSVLSNVPDYQEFLTVDEMNSSSLALAREFPDRVTVLDVGRSRGGEQITALRIGSGSRTGLLFGCPHPNEPIGAMMLEYLTRVLVEDERLAELDVTWYLIKTIDPDGTRLNEGWFKGPFTPEWYARHYYRPPMEEQVEWTFPVEYKRLVFTDPLPETGGLMKLIDQIRPDLVYSLHNAGFGGVYYYLSDDTPELYGVMADLPEREGLPLALGEPEIPSAKVFAPAVFEMPSVRVMYDFYEQFGTGPPEQQFAGGTSSRDYAKGVNPDCLIAVCEVPYFFEPRIADTSLASQTRKDMVLKHVAVMEQAFTFVRRQYGKVEAGLTCGMPHTRSVQRMMMQGQRRLDTTRVWAESSAELNRPGTVAEQVNVDLAEFSAMMLLGSFIQAVNEQLTVAEQAILYEVRDTADEELQRRSNILEASVDYRVIPIKSLVKVELGLALYAVRSMK